jgi:hypothetical protein
MSAGAAALALDCHGNGRFSTTSSDADSTCHTSLFAFVARA